MFNHIYILTLRLRTRLISYFRKKQVSAEYAEMQGYNRVQAALFDEGGFNEREFESWERTLEYEEADCHLWDATMRANWLGVRKCLDDHRHRLTPEPIQTVTTRTSDLTMAHTAGYYEARDYLQMHGHSAYSFNELRDAARMLASEDGPVGMFRSNGIHAYLRDHPLTAFDETRLTEAAPSAQREGYQHANEFLERHGWTANAYEMLEQMAATNTRMGGRNADYATGVRSYAIAFPPDSEYVRTRRAILGQGTYTDANGIEHSRGTSSPMLPGETLVHYSSHDGRRRSTQVRILKGREEGPGSLTYDPARTTFTEPEPYKEPERRLRIRTRKQKDD